MTSHQEDSPQHLPLNQLRHDSHVLKETSELNIVDIMIFDPHPNLLFSFIHSGSQDDWSCESESIDDSKFHSWADNSRFLDETFSSLLSLISKAQTSLEINCIHLKRTSHNPASSIDSSLPNPFVILQYSSKKHYLDLRTSKRCNFDLSEEFSITSLESKKKTAYLMILNSIIMSIAIC